MSIKNPKYHKLVFACYLLSAIFYILLLTVFIKTGKVDVMYIVGTPIILVLSIPVFKNINHLVSYSSYDDYIEFLNAGLPETHKMAIKSFTQRIVKHHIQEIYIKGFGFWKHIKVYLKSDSGRTYTSYISLRFLSQSQTIHLLEDLSGTKFEEVWEADYNTAEVAPVLSNAGA